MKKLQKALAILLSVCMTLGGVGSVTLADTANGTAVVESAPGGGKEIIDVTIAVSEDDTKKRTDTKTPAGGSTSDSGLNVSYSSSSIEKKNADGTTTVTEEKSSYSAINQDATYGASGGSDLSTEENAAMGTVEIPLTKGESNSVTSGDAVGTSSTTGDVPSSEKDGTYDYTTSTTTQQGTITVINKDVTSTQTNSGSPDMEYIYTETNPDADNDLSDEKKYPPTIPAEGEEVSVTEGYGYLYAGMDNHSQFWSAFLYTSPSEDFPDEEPLVIDGKNYYVRRDHSSLGSKHFIERVYIDGELYAEDVKQPAIWSNITQYILIEAETGKYITTYCADLDTPAEQGHSYNIKNIEDATYYEDAQAAMIRTVAQNGYWGVKDDPATEEAELGSLEAIKEMMRSAKDENGNPLFTEEELASLTDGVATTATQYAIWTFSNAMSGMEFIGAHYLKKDGNNKSNFANFGDIPEDKEDEEDLLFKLYEYMINLEPTTIEDETTANTVISPEKFLKDMNLTVVEKAEDHANNQDTDDTNDAYVTNLSFALVVTPSTANGDDLVVTILDATGENIIAQARIAGEQRDGETYLTPDSSGNYTFSGITLVEGDQNFNITLEGIQNLEAGVYLYTSEIKNDLPSQTMVGIAGGEKDVNVSMDICFELSVDDEIVATEHVWRTEWYNSVPEFPPEEEIPDDPPPLSPPPGEEIPDEDVPLAGVPNTGDASNIALYLAIASGAALMLLILFGKKNRKAEN